MKKKIFGIAIAAMLALLFAALVIYEAASQGAQRKAAQALQLEAESYSNEIVSLQNELTARQQALDAMSCEHAAVFICGWADTVGELEQLCAWASAAGFPLAAVLDADGENFAVLLDCAAQNDCCVLLTGSGDGWISRAEAAQAAISAAGAESAGFLYLQENPTDDELAQIAAGDWLGYSLPLGLSDSISTTMSEDGPSQIGHLLLAETNSLNSVAQSAISRGQAYILSIEMNQLGSLFTSASVERILLAHKDRVDTGYLTNESLTQYMDSYATRLAEAAEQREAYEVFAAETEARIADLREALAALYAAQ
ncbi:MAG: hypothetical protein LUH51_02845 [Firmicutes bacterium]|nr:hypothetical protein [Bacillota bacterium]